MPKLETALGLQPGQLIACRWHWCLDQEPSTAPMRLTNPALIATCMNACINKASLEPKHASIQQRGSFPDSCAKERLHIWAPKLECKLLCLLKRLHICAPVTLVCF